MKMRKKISLLLCLVMLVSLLGGSVSIAGAATAEPAKSSVTLDECNGKKIGVLTGSIHDTYAKKYFPDAELEYFTSVSDMVTAVLSGTIDTFSNDILSAYSLLAEHKEFAYIDDPLDYILTAFAFAKNDKGAVLRDEMNAFLKKLDADGSLKALQDKWLSYGADDYALDLSDLSGNEKTIVFATSCSGKPNAYYYNNAPTGYEVELVSMFCREYGYNLDIQVTDFAGIIPGLVGGKYDIGADGIAVTPEREESVNFSTPDYKCPVVMIVQKDADSSSARKIYTAVSQLDREDINLGIVTGMAYESAYAQVTPKAKLSYFNTLTDMIFALQNGQIDGYLDDEPMAKYEASHNDGLICLDEPIGSPVDTAFVFGETDFDLRAQQEFNEFLARIKSDGTLDSIFELWYGTDDEKQVLEYPTEGPNGTLKVCTYAESAPASFVKEEQNVGFEMDMLVRFCREYGYTMEVSSMDFSGLLNGIASGRYDIATGYISVTDERKNSVNFSDPFLSSTPLMVVRSSVQEQSFWNKLGESFNKTFIKESRWKLIAEGIKTTMIISICAAFLGTLLGFGLCLLRRIKSPIIHGVTTVYIRLLQGTPLLVLLMILYYIIFAKSGMSGVLVAIIAFALNFAAYVCEMFRTGIDGVDIGQTEAAYAIGFTKAQTFFRIVMPQAAMHFLPVYKGEFISLVKMTSIVGYIAVQDLTKMSDIIRSRTYDAFFPLIATAIIYFILSSLLTGLLRTVEIKVLPKRNNRKVKGVKMQ